jgi:hypothetical protein
LQLRVFGTAQSAMPTKADFAGAQQWLEPTEFIKQAARQVNSGHAPGSGSEEYCKQFGIRECISAAIKQLFARPFFHGPVGYYL